MFYLRDMFRGFWKSLPKCHCEEPRTISVRDKLRDEAISLLLLENEKGKRCLLE